MNIYLNFAKCVMLGLTCFVLGFRFKRLTGRSEVAISASDYKFYSPRHKYRRGASISLSNIQDIPVCVMWFIFGKQIVSLKMHNTWATAVLCTMSKLQFLNLHHFWKSFTSMLIMNIMCFVICYQHNYDLYIMIIDVYY